MALLEHGGGLRRAAADFGIPLAQWLDLSTGLNPHSWPIPEVPQSCWQRLPEEEDDLIPAAESYYGSVPLLAVSGSQVAIQLLPRLRQPSRVGVFHPAYAEHVWNWRQAGHEVVVLDFASFNEAQLDDLDVLLIVNPNNPTGHRWETRELLGFRQCLADRGGWLLVDEAFMDVTPEHSILPQCGETGLIVLRSVGKFFGLAGLRLGFVAAWPELLERLRQQLGPWHINHPARWLTAQALRDQVWQQQTRRRLMADGERLSSMLEGAGLMPVSGTALFSYWRDERAHQVYKQMAQLGILVRYFDQPRALRFGLPRDESDWQRLQQTLDSLVLG